MTDSVTTRTFTLHDGRQLAGFVDPRPASTALVWCHGTPFPVVPWAPLLDACRARDLRLVAWARPGYAESTPQPGRRVVDFASDAAEVLDAIGAASTLAAGWSGGGPHALSLAAALSDRCRAVISIASVAPSTSGDLDWTAGMGPENVDEFQRATEGGPAFDAWLAEANDELRGIGADELVDSMAGLISPVDAAALGELEMAAMLAACLRSSGVGQMAGWRDDDVAFMTDWGFEVADLVAPVSLWQGSEDLMVPLAHGQWLADHVARATVNLIAGEGHISLLTRRLGEMLDQGIALANAG